METYYRRCVYGSGHTESYVNVAEDKEGLKWYAVEDSLNVNATWDDIEDGVDVELLEDVDMFTASKPITDPKQIEKYLLGEEEIKAEDLFGQISETGEVFNCGYYISLVSGTYYFAEGEETERDEFLAENNVFDEETPDWESLHEAHPDNFYYSEWFVGDGLDGGYDKEGNYYLDVNGEFIPEN